MSSDLQSLATKPDRDAARSLPALADGLSARRPAARWQRVAFQAVALGAAALAFAFGPGERAAALALLSLPFLGLSLLRIAALATGRAAAVAALEEGRPASIVRRDEDWPHYTVLVPLYREAAVLPDLVAALGALDYPATRHDIVIVVEEDDEETRVALASIGLPAHFRCVVVPPGEPRTKPRALNYALARTKGDIVTVFDAEDMPEPLQLKKAALALAAGGPRMGCVQARLNIYNRSESFLTRQFAIEYTTQFDRLLGTYQRLGLPMPLGGTSNHFPRRVLESVGAWDAYNVTEDADLGVRLARAGFKVAVLDATTWEEAPARLGVWRGQRTRWLKGWMQTWIVHMRDPRSLLADLGWRGFWGFQLMMGAMVLSALVHPWFYVMLALDGSQSALFAMPETGAARTLWWVAAANLVTGYIAAILLGAVAVAGRGWKGLALHALLMPLYWLGVSMAAYRALWQLARRPFYWEKTDHAARTARSQRGAGPH